MLIMSILRQDILTGEWVIFATNRKKRPYHFIKKSIGKIDKKNCQFCPGHEDMTPASIYEKEKNGKWTIRVFPNMFPAVSENGDKADGEGFYHACDGTGCHELVVDTPVHEDSIYDFSVDYLIEVLKTLKERLDLMKRRDDIEYVQIFKNCGPDAGASISHSHWQIMGIPIVPENQMATYITGRTYYEKNNRCIFCDMIEHELKQKIRVVMENKNIIAFVPFASKMSYEVWIAPKKHLSSFSDFDEEIMKDFAEVFTVILNKVKDIFYDICYNISFQDMPAHAKDKEHCHWYARVLPRLGNPAGFEFATGSYVNPILPERAAEYYRGVKEE